MQTPAMDYQFSRFTKVFILHGDTLLKYKIFQNNKLTHYYTIIQIYIFLNKNIIVTNLCIQIFSFQNFIQFKFEFNMSCFQDCAPVSII